MDNLETIHNYNGDNLIITNDFKFIGINSNPFYNKKIDSINFNYTEINIPEVVNYTEITIFELIDRKITLDSNHIQCILTGIARIKEKKLGIEVTDEKINMNSEVSSFILKDYMEKNYSNIENSYTESSYKDKIKQLKNFQINYNREIGKTDYSYKLTLPDCLYYDAGFKIFCLKGLKCLKGN